MNSVAFEPKVVVYKATNLVNGHTYIGFTTQGLPQRIRDHRRCANRGEGWLLHAAMRKHGHDNIVFETVYDFEGDEELAKLYEIEAIAKYRPEYNIARGGDGGTVHPDTARKISEANKGRPSFLKGKKFSPEALAKFRATKAANGKPPPGLGKKMPEHVKIALATANASRPSNFKGRKHTEETRKKLSEAALKRPPRPPVSESTKAKLRAGLSKGHATNRRPVKCLEDGRVFAGATDADRFYGLRLGAVSKMILGDCKSVRGMHFVRYEAPK